MTDGPTTFIAFEGARRIASGDLADVADAVKRAAERDPAARLAVFDRATGRPVDLDLRGAEAEVVARYAPPPSAGVRRGRPKLGVVSREVTLLPRHWDWLARQPGGASTSLRRLVEAARKADAGATETRERAEAAYRFMSATGGDLEGFEEAARALFAGDRDRLEALLASWPADLRDEVLALLGRAPSDAG